MFLENISYIKNQFIKHRHVGTRCIFNADSKSACDIFKIINKNDHFLGKLQKLSASQTSMWIVLIYICIYDKKYVTKMRRRLEICRFWHLKWNGNMYFKLKVEHKLKLAHIKLRSGSTRIKIHGWFCWEILTIHIICLRI